MDHDSEHDFERLFKPLADLLVLSLAEHVVWINHIKDDREDVD